MVGNPDGTPTTPEQRKAKRVERIKRIEARRERQQQALELRKTGASYEEIAAKLGYHGKSGACKLVKSALRSMIQEPAKNVARLENIRLDALQSAIWNAAVSGDLAAFDRVLRIMERRAALQGLDAKANSKMEISANVSPSAAAALVSEIFKTPGAPVDASATDPIPEP